MLLVLKTPDGNVFVNLALADGEVLATDVSTGAVTRTGCATLAEAAAALRTHGFSGVDEVVTEAPEPEPEAPDPLDDPRVQAVLTDGEVTRLALGVDGNGMDGVDLEGYLGERSLERLEALQLRVNYTWDDLDRVFEGLRGLTLPLLRRLYVEECSQANAPENRRGRLKHAGWWEPLVEVRELGLELVHLPPGAARLPKLERLWWWTAVPESAEVQALLNPSLEQLAVLSLDFSGGLLSDDARWALEDFAPLLEGRYPRLRELHLNGVDMSLELLRALLESDVCPGLDALSIVSNPFEDGDGEADLVTPTSLLLEHAEKLGRVQRLELSEPDASLLSAEQLEAWTALSAALEQALPQATVSWRDLGTWDPLQVGFEAFAL